MFQLYRGSQFYWWRKPEDPEKTTDRKFSILQRYNAPTLFSKFAESFKVMSSNPVHGEVYSTQQYVIKCGTTCMYLALLNLKM